MHDLRRAARGLAWRRRAELREALLPVAQTGLAAALAWLVAIEVAGHGVPFFAPVAATLVTGLALGQRGRRALEVLAGVTLGILVGDVFLQLVGEVGPPEVGAFVVAAMLAAVVLGGTPLIVVQATVSAVLVATIPPSPGELDFERTIDAAIGGGIGFAVHALLPIDPLVRARRAAEPLVADLATVLADIANGLRTRDREEVSAVLDRTAALRGEVDRFRARVGEGRQTARVAPGRRRSASALTSLGEACEQLDDGVGNVRVLARGVLRAVQLGDRVPLEVAQAICDLARAVNAVGASLVGSADGATARDGAIEAAAGAAGRATRVLETTTNLSVVVLVGQVRSIAVDLLRALGAGEDAARRLVREAADRGVGPRLRHEEPQPILVRTGAWSPRRAVGEATGSPESRARGA